MNFWDKYSIIFRIRFQKVGVSTQPLSLCPSETHFLPFRPLQSSFCSSTFSTHHQSDAATRFFHVCLCALCLSHPSTRPSGCMSPLWGSGSGRIAADRRLFTHRRVERTKLRVWIFSQISQHCWLEPGALLHPTSEKKKRDDNKSSSFIFITDFSRWCSLGSTSRRRRFCLPLGWVVIIQRVFALLTPLRSDPQPQQACNCVVIVLLIKCSAL